MDLQRRWQDMNVYARRRLAVTAIGAGLAIALIAVIAATSGGGEHENPSPRTGQDKAQPAPLTAKARNKHVKLPRRVAGEGAFMTIERRTVRLDDVQDPGRMVALTFDDGPDRLTPAFLKKLKQLKVKASFFVLGANVGEHPQIVRQAAQQGHTIANHTYGHPDMRSLGRRDQQTEIVRTQGLIEEATGSRPYFFRFPGHDWNFKNVRQVAQQGLVAVRFSIDVQDWRAVGRRAIIDNALAAKPGDVIQLHDGGPDRGQTLEALGPIVRGLRRRNLEPVTLDELYRSTAR